MHRIPNDAKLQSLGDHLMFYIMVKESGYKNVEETSWPFTEILPVPVRCYRHPQFCALVKNMKALTTSESGD